MIKGGIPTEEDLKRTLKGLLKSARYNHTRGVVETASDLAEAHGMDSAQARLAGWMHDSAKCLTPARMKALAREAGADDVEMATPSLWHAPAGSVLAKKRFGVIQHNVLDAVRYHTTGAPAAAPLTKLLFVADYCEPGRRYGGTKRLRKLAAVDLDAAYLEVLREKLDWVLEKRQALHTRSVEAYNDALRTRRA